MKTFVVTYLGHRGCLGHENVFPDSHYIKANSSAEAMMQLQSAGGFCITSENRRSHVGPMVFVPYHAVIAITEREE